jgi:methylthioribose-1-phosphate isomerase
MRPLEYVNGKLRLIDQTKLPTELIYVECATCLEVAAAIRDMVVRGAPAIGVTAAYGAAIGAAAVEAGSSDEFFSEFDRICDMLTGTRPTAVNLSWAVGRMRKKALEYRDRPLGDIKEALIREACAMDREDVEINKRIGANGSSLIREGSAILTHCNAGALATCDYGTALGVIRAAHEAGRNIRVYADETRPYLQGARLTAWELQQDNIPVTLICDNMAGYFMKAGKIDCVIVGADRIALNGDTANKIGTYTVAVLAKENAVPFYVAAPVSTIDFKTETGDEIPIEERKAAEVTHIMGVRIAPDGVRAANPSFDVTPGRYISAIITEKGVIRPPYEANIRNLDRNS